MFVVLKVLLKRMWKNILLFISVVFLTKAATQYVDYIKTTPVIIQEPTFDAKWENLLPTLKLIKCTSNMKKERLLNVVRIIKFLLSDEIEKKECDKILEDIKETKDYGMSGLPDIDSIVDERLKPIKDAIDGYNCLPDFEPLQNEEPMNKTEDLSKILEKISAALANIKENDERPDPQALMGMFRSGNNEYKNNYNPPLFENLGQSPKLSKGGLNSMTHETKFNIPCQRAADILKETSSLAIPKVAYCDITKRMNLESTLNDPKFNSDKRPFRVLPNSVSCVDSDDPFAILFKPKKISMMQVYGNLLKKITITVLVPYHVSKLGL